MSKRKINLKSVSKDVSGTSSSAVSEVEFVKAGIDNGVEVLEFMIDITFKEPILVIKYSRKDQIGTHEWNGSVKNLARIMFGS